MSNPVSNRLAAAAEDPTSEPNPVGQNADFDLPDGAITHSDHQSGLGLGVALQRTALPALPSPSDPIIKDQTKHRVIKDQTKHRGGLPEGFISRVGRFGRTVLFVDNVYRLPNGLEFIPQPPSGTLGGRNHHYALLTLEQFEKRRRGSVYLRTDGRIFDYACDHGLPERELFDTGFTIHDLERTGRYAPKLKLKVRGPRKKGKKRRAKRKARA